MSKMHHLQTGQSFDGLDVIAAQLEKSEGGKMNMGNVLDQCHPEVIPYIIHHLHK
jgi:hypothetical protein